MEETEPQDVDARDVDAPAGLRVGLDGPQGPVTVHVWPARAEPGPRPPGRRGRLRSDQARRPLLLAFHGWTDSGEVFAPLARALGGRWTVVAPDAPGHGGTRWRPAPQYALDDQAHGALAVLDALPVVAGRRAPVVVLGHSMGALPALAAARARPRWVRHVVLEDPVRTTQRALRSPAARRREVRRMQALDHAGRVAEGRGRHPDWPQDELAAWARSTAEVDLRHLQVPTAWGEPLVARLARVRSPVTLVHGRRDRGALVSPTGARRVAAACRSGCEVLALDAGHSVRREARAAFVAALAQVLSRYES